MAEPQPYTVQIDDLVRPVSIADALQTWRGYVKTHEGEQALPAPPAAFINGPEHHRHLQNVHTDVQPIRDLGLYFLPDALVSSHCFVFAGDLFVLDGSTPNRIALRYAEEEGYLGAANRRGHTLLEMDQPGLVVA